MTGRQPCSRHVTQVVLHAYDFFAPEGNTLHRGVVEALHTVSPLVEHMVLCDLPPNTDLSALGMLPNLAKITLRDQDESGTHPFLQPDQGAVTLTLHPQH